MPGKRIYASHKEKLRVYRERDRERHNAKRREWAKANPDKVREIMRRWYEANKERIKPGGSKKYRARPLSEKQKEYYRQKARRQRQRIMADPILREKERLRTNELARRRRKLAAGKYTPADIVEIRAQQRDRCAICRRKLRLRAFHVDHIKPLALGGDNTRKNIQLLCPKCNGAKAAKDPLDHMRSLGRLL